MDRGIVAAVIGEAGSDDCTDLLVPDIGGDEVEVEVPGEGAGEVLGDLVGDVDSGAVAVEGDAGGARQRGADLSFEGD